jgi:hypothetical protein
VAHNDPPQPKSLFCKSGWNLPCLKHPWILCVLDRSYFLKAGTEQLHWPGFLFHVIHILKSRNIIEGQKGASTFGCSRAKDT